MDKAYNHKEVEERLYKNWEEKGYFRPEINPEGKAYSIILPPPNANGDLHFGHAMFTVEDILIRYHRMKGEAALWLPGTDHAGTETQFVFEKKLQAEGKSRFDFTREELYKMIWGYVQENRGGIENQLKRLGFSLDWSRQKFTLDEDIVKTVNETFRRMYEQDKLVYRDYRLVNYCTKDGTSFSDLEVEHEERVDPLYYVKYGPLVLATTRPETKFGDTAVMVHPSDKRYQQYVGKEIEIETVLGKATIKVIADESVDPEFGTGVVKVTPAHDFNDFEVGRRHNLQMKQVIGFDGKMNEHAGKFAGLYVKQARKVVVEEMQKKGLIEKIDEAYVHRIGLCYKCKTVLEPLPLEQWYIKVKPLTEMALKAVDSGFINIYPKNFLMTLRMWYQNLRDWNISRQNVWGIRIPIWYEVENESWFAVSYIDGDKKMHQGTLSQLLKEGHKFEDVVAGLQRVIAKIEAKVAFEDQKEEGKRYLPETDTFDTWFSSAQWPYVTLQTARPGDFKKFYPTSVMETGRDILFFWVSRMIMMGLYYSNGLEFKEVDETILEDKIPFRDVVLHGIVNDPYGKKMSKSKGNVVNPLDLIDQYGADSVRFALIYGNATGNDQSLSYPKLEASRKFANKLWNIARFIEMNTESGDIKYFGSERGSLSLADNPPKVKLWCFDVWNEVEELEKEISKYLDSYQFNLAAERIYEYSWHKFADLHIEKAKSYLSSSEEDAAYARGLLIEVYKRILVLLHPFMPFVTEEIYQKFHPDRSIMLESWPISQK